MPTRNPIKNFFVTFPQWEQDSKRSQILDILREVTDITEYGICCETHKDKGIHYHALIQTNGITHAKFLKKLKKILPVAWKKIHYRPVRSWNKCLNYIKKEDTDPLLSEGCVEKCHQKTKKITTARKFAYLVSTLGDSFGYDLSEMVKQYIEEGIIKGDEKLPDHILDEIFEKLNYPDNYM